MDNLEAIENILFLAVPVLVLSWIYAKVVKKDSPTHYATLVTAYLVAVLFGAGAIWYALA